MTDGNNNLGSIGSFSERLYYRQIVYPDRFTDRSYPSPIDLWYEKPFYGKVNHNNEIVFLTRDKLKQIPSRDFNVFVADFVADAYEDLATYISYALTINKIQPDGSVLVDLRPKRGWVSLDLAYEKYLDTIYLSFIQDYTSDDKISNQITSFESFLNVFLDYIKIVSKTYSFTKNDFIKSQFCLHNVSGLVIDLFIENHAEDSTKFEKFIADPNFIFFAKAARKFGFFIDKNAPWRLIANLASPAMVKYMVKYPEIPDRPKKEDFFFVKAKIKVDMSRALPTSGRINQIFDATVVSYNEDAELGIVKLSNGSSWAVPISDISSPDYDSKYEEFDKARKAPKTSINNVFNTYYKKADIDNLNLLKNELKNFYNSFVFDRPKAIINKICKTKTTKKTITREPITDEGLASISDIFWIEYYAKVRFMETRSSMSKKRFNKFIQEIKNISKYRGSEMALIKVNETFSS